MKKIKSFLLSRKSILVQILLILAVVFAGYGLPQRVSTSPLNIGKWRDAHPALVPWVDRLGLDHIYTTSWFAVLLCVFLLTLIISSYDQIATAFRKIFRDVFTDQKGITLHVSEEELISLIKKKGYLFVGKQDTIKRFVKHPWGYWGNVLMHLGFVLIIASSLIVLLLQNRSLLQLVEEEIYFPGNPWAVEEKGLLAKDFILPEAIRLEKVTFDFYESDKPKSLSTAISFIDPQGRFKKYSVGINQIVKFKGVRIYQSNSFGHAFFVEFTDKDGKTEKIILNIDHPLRRDRPSYKDFEFEGIPYSIRAHYYVDADKKSMHSNNPLLNILIIDKEKSVKEVSLKIGESHKLGPYTARLVYVSRWSELIFVKDPGMSGIFAGSIIIIIGVMFTYFMPPREFLVRNEYNELSLVWRPSKFEEFYENEFKDILSAFAGKIAQ